MGAIYFSVVTIAALALNEPADFGRLCGAGTIAGLGVIGRCHEVCAVVPAKTA
jgi:hypothetical protein